LCLRKGGTGEWKRWLCEGLHALYSSPDIIRPKQAWRMRWKEHVERRGDQKFRWNCHLKKPGKAILQDRGTKVQLRDKQA